MRVRSTTPFAVLMILLYAGLGFAQARVVSAPPEPSLLNLTRQWASASTLGDLQELRASADLLELRVWGGFDQGETQAVILRRTSGRWSAFLARVIRCEIQIPITVGDTASSATMRHYVAEARRRCGTSVDSAGPGAQIIATDTLVVQPLEVQPAEIEAAWNSALSAGVLRLPPRVNRSPSVAVDGFTYLVELRRGDEYRASQIERVGQPETEADTQVQQVYAAVRRLLP